jgi:hypothetical protein
MSGSKLGLFALSPLPTHNFKVVYTILKAVTSAL